MFCRTALAATAAMTLATSLPAPAQTKDAWPTPTITLVQPYATGGPSDMLAHILAQALEQRIDATVTVQSHAGANGSTATALVSRARPDGSIFLVGSSSPVVILPALHNHLPYDPVKDLTPITPIARAPFLLVTSPKSGIHSVQDLVAQAKAGKIKFGSAGTGSPQHAIAEMFNTEARIQAVHIPYKGSAPLAMAVVANEVQYAIDSPVPLKRQIDAGRLQALAITSKAASSKFPGVKSLQAQGFGNFEVAPWYGVMGTKDLPRELAERMNQHLQAILAQDSVRKKIADLGAEPFTLGTADFARLIATDLQKWGVAVKASGIRAR